MPTDLQLPDGNTATLRDPKALTERQRRPLRQISSKIAAMPGFAEAMGNADDWTKVAALTGGDLGAVMTMLADVTDATIVAFVESWSYDFPVTADALLDLPSPVYDALAEATRALSTESQPDFEPSPALDSPTQPGQL